MLPVTRRAEIRPSALVRSEGHEELRHTVLDRHSEQLFMRPLPATRRDRSSFVFWGDQRVECAMGIEGLLREGSIALERVGCSPHWSACSRTGVPARRPHWSASSTAALECQQLIVSGVTSR